MRVVAHIDLSALKHNFEVVKQKAPRSQVMAMIKANAYGHGLLLCAKALPDVDYFGVASFEEAKALREIGVKRPILLTSGFQNQEDLISLQKFALDTVVYDERQLALLTANNSVEKIRVWLKIDTGMHRLGCAVDQAEYFLRQLEAMPQVEIVAVMSHLACADIKDHSHTLRQLETFEAVTKGWDYPRSIVNSPGLLYYPEAYYEIVRPGLMLYGASPSTGLSVEEIGLRPVMELTATILALIQVKKGEGVGYGQDWVATRDSLIATIAVGYGDGYPHYPNNTVALVQGQACPLVGRASMDSLAVDVTDLAQVFPGESVLLWGQDLPVNEVARRAGVSVYRLLTGVMERVTRKMFL